MKVGFIGILLAVSILVGSSSLQKAYEAYENKDYPASVLAYQIAIKDYPEMSSTIRYNLAQSYLAMDSIKRAVHQFRLCMDGQDPIAASKAANQLGVMLSQQAKDYDALDLFKRALIMDPSNEKARYNYEVTARFLKKQEDALQQNQNLADQSLPNSPSAMDDDLINRIKGYPQMIPGNNMDVAQPVGQDTLPMPLARQLLDKMKRENTQFIQQLRKKTSTPSRKSSKPDW